jgi:hypothetical protein
MKKYFTIVMAAMMVGLLIHTAYAGYDITQPAERKLAVVTFSCLQFENVEDLESYSRVTLVERSSENVPMQEISENCTDYLARLLSTGTSAENENERPFPNANSCDELIDHDSMFPPSMQKDYKNCESFVLYGFW